MTDTRLVPPRQLGLPLRRARVFRREDFVVGPSNRDSVTALDDWSGGALALFGPAGVGKSHLARVWASRQSAVTNPHTVEGLNGKSVLLEDVDQGVDEEELFHLLNLADQPGGSLLLTARTPPATWVVKLPDLRSRLNALPVCQIQEPDDQVLEGALRLFFAERSIRPPEDVYGYLVWRMERSIPAAREIVRKLDELAIGDSRAITRLLARQILEDRSQNIDLFDR